MANHVYCSLDIEGTKEELEKFFEENRGDDGPLDFGKATPPPPEGANEYSWTVDQWGTKWNAQDCEHEFQQITDYDDDEGRVKHVLHYQFFTAWDEPYGWFNLVAEKYPHLGFSMRFEDEGWMHCGFHEAFNAVVDYNKYTYGDPEFREMFLEAHEGMEEGEAEQAWAEIVEYNGGDSEDSEDSDPESDESEENSE